MVSDAGVAEILTAAPSLAVAAQRLVAAANEAGGRDNITVVLFRVEDVTPEEGAVVSQHTSVGEAVRAPDEPAPAPAAATQTAVGGWDRVMQVGASTIEPRAPRPPRHPRHETGPRKRRRWVGVAKGLAVLAILLALVVSGGIIASQSVYFVATDDDGFVTLYSGLPYELPGVDLFQTQFTSGVPAESLSPRVKQTITDHKLRSHDDAVDLIRQIERGELAGQYAS